jgi:hypothetical protein
MIEPGIQKHSTVRLDSGFARRRAPRNDEKSTRSKKIRKRTGINRDTRQMHFPMRAASKRRIIAIILAKSPRKPLCCGQ